jgi:hypothetical protein
MAKRNLEHSFSVEMNSQVCVRKMTFLEQESGHVFLEGFLGELKNVSMIEGLMLQIEGANGVIRVDIDRKDLESCLAAKTALQGGEQ